MFKELLTANRSYRGYDETYQLTKEELLEFIDCTRLAPSSANIQPFKYYLAWEKEKVNQIQSFTKWAGALPELNLPYEGKRPTGFIVICQDLTMGKPLAKFQKDVGIVAHTILLAATEKGLGGCMIGNFGAAPLKEALNLEDNLMPVLVVALGKPAEEIVLTDLEEDGSIKYYRNEEDVHFVPKRKLDDLIL